MTARLFPRTTKGIDVTWEHSNAREGLGYAEAMRPGPLGMKMSAQKPPCGEAMPKDRTGRVLAQGGSTPPKSQKPPHTPNPKN